MPKLEGQQTGYSYNAVNQLLSIDTPEQTFDYDADGNLTKEYTKDGYVFTADYDAENRTISLEYTDTLGVIHKIEYAYSGDDLLSIVKTYEDGTLVEEIRILRDGMLALQDRDGSNAITREYTWGLNLGGGIGGLLNLKQSGQNYSYLYDGKGNVEALIDQTQAVVAAYRYAPFGKLLAQSGSLTQPFGFSTKRFEPLTGLVYYGYRFYSTDMDRWTTRDPLGEAGGINLYAFVENNPVNWWDSWGLTKGGPQHGGGPLTGNDIPIKDAKDAFNSGDRQGARKLIEKEIDSLSEQAKKSSGKARNKLLKRAKHLRGVVKVLLRTNTIFLPVILINPATNLPIGMYPKGDPSKPYDPIHNPCGMI